MSGVIGTITHKITKQVFNDEIKFYIPVTNPTDIERCYIVKLYDEGGQYIDKEPGPAAPVGTYANRIAPRATEMMILDSNYKSWHIGTVEGQTVRFDLISIPSDWLTHYCSMNESSYTLYDTKNYAIANYYPDVIEKYAWAIIIIIIIAAYVFAKTK